MNGEPTTSEARVRHALAALELAGIQNRRRVRLRLRVGEEELSALLYLAHHGGVTQRRLADVTSLSRSGAGSMIQRLEERGYVHRSPDTVDKRLRLVELSPAGRDALADAYRDLHAAASELLRDAAEPELDELARILRGLANAARSPHGVAAEPTPLPSDGEPIWRRWG